MGLWVEVLKFGPEVQDLGLQGLERRGVYRRFLCTGVSGVRSGMAP